MECGADIFIFDYFPVSSFDLKCLKKLIKCNFPQFLPVDIFILSTVENPKIFSIPQLLVGSIHMIKR